MSSMFDVKKFAITAVAVLSTVCLTATANAVPTLRLTQTSVLIPEAGLGPATVTVVDEGAGDITSGAPGSVGFNGAIGNFGINVSTGITTPVLGSHSDPILDLNSIDVNVNNPGTLVIEFSETDFNVGTTIGHALSVIGGTTAGTLRFQTFASLSNTVFAQDILLGDSGVMSGPFLFENLSSVALTGNFSLTTVVTIEHLGVPAQNTSFNSILEIAEPALAPPVILGILLFGANAVARRRRR